MRTRTKKGVATMTIKNGKIAKATESELFGVYLKRGLDDIMSFPDYKRRCVELGTEIVEED
jgi:hypothetical protein